MAAFDLAQALDDSPEFEQRGREAGCFDMTDVKDQVFRLDQGLDLVVSHNPRNMKSVATLLLAMSRMKKALPCSSSRKLSDDDLCSIIMDSLVDETVVVETDSYRSTGHNISHFHRTSGARHCTLSDTSHKEVVIGPGECRLQAITLRGGHGDRRVVFKLSKYVGPVRSVCDGQTVVLTITNTDMHISCRMKDGRAVMHLEECSDQDLQMISDGGTMNRFLFYKRTTGLSLSTFESLQCRGWFISTSHEAEEQPVEMCQNPPGPGKRSQHVLLKAAASAGFCSVNTGPEETREDQKRPERTRRDQKRPEETREDQRRPEETREDQKRLEKTRENQTGSEKTREDQRRPEETRGDQKRPEKTRGDQRRPEKTRGDQRGPERTRKDQKRLEETGGDQKRPEETRGDQRGPERTREDQKRPEKTGGDRRRPEETRGDQRRPEETREDQRGPEKTRKDWRRPEETRRDQRRPEETREDQRGPEKTREKTRGDQKRPEGEKVKDQRRPDGQRVRGVRLDAWTAVGGWGAADEEEHKKKKKEEKKKRPAKTGSQITLKSLLLPQAEAGNSVKCHGAATDGSGLESGERRRRSSSSSGSSVASIRCSAMNRALVVQLPAGQAVFINVTGQLLLLLLLLRGKDNCEQAHGPQTLLHTAAREAAGRRPLVTINLFN
ncbi:uncharacterized protein V6R79_006376 [Siganus canaliculatus]